MLLSELANPPGLATCPLVNDAPCNVEKEAKAWTWVEERREES